MFTITWKKIAAATLVGAAAFGFGGAVAQADSATTQHKDNPTHVPVG